MRRVQKMALIVNIHEKAREGLDDVSTPLASHASACLSAVQTILQETLGIVPAQVRHVPVITPPSGWQPLRRRCIQNALLLRMPPTTLVFGYRVSVGISKTSPVAAAYRLSLNERGARRLGRIELDPHVWNTNPATGEWVDTTPEEDGEPFVVNAEDPTGIVRQYVARYLRGGLRYAIGIDEALRLSDDDILLRDAWKPHIAFSKNGAMDITVPQGRRIDRGNDDDWRKMTIGVPIVLYAGSAVYQDYAPTMHKMDGMGMTLGMAVDFTHRLELLYRKACWWCGRVDTILVCARCHRATYCSPECQRQDWRAGHLYECQPK